MEGERNGGSKAQSDERQLSGAEPEVAGLSVQLPSSEQGRICDRNSILAFGLYAALSLLFIGRGLIFDYSNSYVGRGPDPSLFIWAITWWPFAISHWLNPFLSKIIFAPGGTNLAWTTTVPFASLLLWPISVKYGSLAAYNCFSLLAPAFAAWGAFILCRHLTRAFWPANVGAYIFGFSSYMLGQTLGGHLHLTCVFLVPMVLYFVVRWFDGTLSSSRAAILIGVTLAALFYLSVEIFVTTTLFGGLTWLLALEATKNPVRRRLVELFGVLACGYAAALLLVSPYIYYLIAYGLPHGEIWDTLQFSADLLNYVIPTDANALGAFGPLRRISTAFPGNIFERTAYLGPVLIGVTIVYAYHHWKEPFDRVLSDVLLVVVVLSFGPELHIGGHQLIGMPGKLFAIMPLIDKALPVRFTMFAVLTVAIITSLWFASSGASIAKKSIVAILIVIFSIPNMDAHYWVSESNTPSFFSAGLYKKYLRPGEIVMVTPCWILGNSMLWQAQSDMYFRMAGGYTGPLPVKYKRWPVMRALSEFTYLPDPKAQVMSFLARHQVSAVIVSDTDPDGSLWQKWLPSSVGAPIEVGGVKLYRIPSSAIIQYRGVSAAEAERQADSALFDGLLIAAAEYKAQGRKAELLTPFRAERLDLIPSSWVPGAVWVPDWLVGTKFDMTRDSKGRIYRGVWLGYVDKVFLGIGIKGTYTGLRPIIDRYRSYAYRIYFPYPHKLTDNAHNTDQVFLLLFFDANGFKHAVASISERTSDGAESVGH